MRKAIQISIPEPCHENWAAMTPKTKGRHCKVCEKTVFDFTSKTDEYIVKTFEQNGKLCGRFKNSQLNRELSYSRKDNNNYLSYLVSSLFAFLAFGVNEAYAQGEPISISKPYKTSHPHQVKEKVAHLVLKERVISGTIFDENDLPMPGVSILIKGSSTGTQTDFDGYFTLKIKNGNILTLNSIGYKNKEVLITNSSTYNLSLEVDINSIDEIILTGGVDIDYVYQKSPKEIAREQRKDSIRKHNHKVLSNRLFKERIEAQKAKRKRIRSGKIKRTRVGIFLYRVTNIFRKSK